MGPGDVLGLVGASRITFCAPRPSIMISAVGSRRGAA
jgi:hypothetical protein